MRDTPTLLAIVFIAIWTPNAAAQDWHADPTYGTVELRQGFRPDPYATALTAGGGTAVSIEGCRFGHVASAPDIDLKYNTSGGSTLYIYVRSNDDTTLLINLSSGSWACDDDGLGNGNPLVVIPNAPAGLYDIWVGTYSDDLSDATVYISEIDPRGKVKE